MRTIKSKNINQDHCYKFTIKSFNWYPHRWNCHPQAWSHVLRLCPRWLQCIRSSVITPDNMCCQARFVSASRAKLNKCTTLPSTNFPHPIYHLKMDGSLPCSQGPGWDIIQAYKRPHCKTIVHKGSCSMEYCVSRCEAIIFTVGLCLF